MTLVCLLVRRRKGSRKASLKDYVSMHMAAGKKSPRDENKEHSRFPKLEKLSTDNWYNTKNKLLHLCYEENNKYKD